MIMMILTKNIKEYCAERKLKIKNAIAKDFSDFIKSIDDYGDKYNCIEDLK